MRMLLASLLLLAATASAADRTTLRDVVGLRLATCEAVYLLHVDGYTFARFEDLRAESSAPNQFGFPTFSIADDVAYASGVVDADRAAQPVVMVTEFHSIVGSTSSGIATTVRIKHTVTTPCSGLTPTQCASRHNLFLLAMIEKYPPVR